MKKILLLFLILNTLNNCYSQTGVKQNWTYYSYESFDGFTYGASVTYSYEDTIAIQFEKLNNEIHFYLLGPPKKGHYCKIQLRFDGDKNYYMGDVQSLFQGEVIWYFFPPTAELKEMEKKVIEKFKTKSYVFVKIYCSEDNSKFTRTIDREYRFSLKGSSSAINKVLSK